MPEGVRVDVRQIVTGRELPEPTGDAVGVHVLAVVLGEHKAGIHPSVPVGDLQSKLFPFMQPEQIHGFGGKVQIANIAGLGIAQVNALAFGGHQGLVYFDPVPLKVHLVPLQPHDLPTAAAGDNQKVSNQLPFQWLPLQGVQNSGDLLGLEIVRIMPFYLGRGGLRSGVIGDQHFFFCLGQNGGDQAVMFQDCLFRERRPVLLNRENVSHLFAHGPGDCLRLVCSDCLPTDSHAHGSR